MIDTSGNVGIGTTNPHGVLGVHVATDLNLNTFLYGGTELALAAHNDAANAYEPLRIEASSLSINQGSGGNVGIGTTTPAVTLDVKGAMRSTANTTPTTGKGIEILSNSGDGIVQAYDRDASAYKLLDLYGSTVTTHNTSDARLKTDIVDLSATSTLDAILQLRPVTFRWKDAHLDAQAGQQVGLIAQEVQNVFPQFVTTIGTSTAVLGDGSKIVVPDTKTLNYEGFIVPLIKAVQDIANLSGTFKTNLIAWLASAENGIHDLYASIIHASEGHFSKEICIAKSDGSEECLTGDQLAAMAAAGAPTHGTSEAPATIPSAATSATSGPPGMSRSLLKKDERRCSP